MPDYREIYNDVFEKEHRYNLAENSPGLRTVVQASDNLSVLYGRSLDIGCGVGFAIEYLSGPNFDFRTFGVDVSDVSIERAKLRLANIPGMNGRLRFIDSQELPFEDNYFALVTCFDVFEHLELADIEFTLSEIRRVLKPGALFLGTVSCRKSGMVDLNGDNLHRTVQSVDWWVDQLAPDRVEFDVNRSQLTIWKRQAGISATGNLHRQLTQANIEAQTAVETDDEDKTASTTRANSDPEGSAALYQKIYDEQNWYGNADEDRCPGVRLLPQYQDWLISPIIDLGCGRGQTVENLRGLGFEADGIDQIKIHPEMHVGDITKTLPDIGNYRSTVCIDCIEHLLEDQVLGLFANMKQVERQAFSIHNGESIGTGVELHVNRQSFVDWDKLIREHFDIAAAIKVHDQQMLYLTTSKKN